jgi:glycosyltransferase involved in cell wall biosynthesis
MSGAIPRPHRVLLLTTVMEAGGAQKAMMQLARGLKARGHDVTVVAMYDKTGSIPGYEERFGVSVTDLAMRSGSSLPGRAVAPVRGIVRLYTLIRRNRIEVLQSFTHYSNLVGPIVGWLGRVPLRITSQRNPLRDRSPLLGRADRWISASGLAHGMVAVSNAIRDYCVETEGLPPGKVVVIPNGIDLTEWTTPYADRRRASVRESLEIRPDQFVVITVARLHPQKGHSVLLKAARAVIDRCPEVRFVWVGDGPLREALAREVREIRLNEHVLMLGTRTDIAPLLLASDLFVLPSLWEGMSNAVLEAMAVGRPVVATTVEGTPEVVQDGVTGWLVPPGDPSSLARGIEQAIGDGAGRRRMGEAGRLRIQHHFGLDRYVGGFETLYERLLDGDPV